MEQIRMIKTMGTNFKKKFFKMTFLWYKIFSKTIAVLGLLPIDNIDAFKSQLQYKYKNYRLGYENNYKPIQALLINTN